MPTRRQVTIGIELRVTTGQLEDDMDELTAIRQHFAGLADQLMRSGPGSRAVSLTWAVDRLPGGGQAIFPERERSTDATGH